MSKKKIILQIDSDQQANSFDRVVALEGGRVAEAGTHAELLAAGGLYARLHAMQFRT